MNREQFKASLVHDEPPHGLSAPLAALWWDAKGKLDSRSRTSG